VSPAVDRVDAGRGGRGRGGDRGRGPAGGRGGARFGTRADSGEVAENGYDAGTYDYYTDNCSVSSRSCSTCMAFFAP
jgi:hypothetical protein